MQLFRLLYKRRVITRDNTAPVRSAVFPLQCLFRCLHRLMNKACLQCYDAVGWVAGRASGLKKT